MRPRQVALVILLTVASCEAAQKGNSVVIRSAPRVQFPGVVSKDKDPQEPGDIDCSSPAHWADGTMHIFFSTGHPYRSSGPDLFHLSRPSQRVSFDNEATWKMGPRWIEATHKAKDGRLYMWYHNEPPLPGGRTAPRIGAMVSTDDGLHWQDLGIVVEAPPGSNNSESANQTDAPSPSDGRCSLSCKMLRSEEPLRLESPSPFCHWRVHRGCRPLSLPAKTTDTMGIMKKAWVYKRKNITGWWVGWYEGGKKRAKALPSKALAKHFCQIKYTQLNSDVFTGVVNSDWHQMV
jgi:hypothetical protein